MSGDWTPRHEWIAQFLMEDATAKLAPCEMAYRIIDALAAIARIEARSDATPKSDAAGTARAGLASDTPSSQDTDQ